MFLMVGTNAETQVQYEGGTKKIVTGFLVQNIVTSSTSRHKQY